MDYKLRATDTLTQHATHAMEQWRASAGADYPAWIDADDSGLVCHDCGTVFVDAVSSDQYGDTRAQLAEVRANRAAEFFGQARAARDDVAAGAYPTLSPIVRTPIFSNGALVGHAYGRIVANLAPSVRVNPPYLVALHNSGVRVGAFSRELELA